MSTWSFVIVLAVIAVALAYALAELRKNYQALQAQYQEAQRILSFKRTLPNRLDASKREYYDRLSQLGFQTLEEYQCSELWLRTKRRYRSSDYPQRCLVCGACDFDLHHRTYARLGEEELFDLVPLCSMHHKQLHDLLDQDPTLCVKDTHDYLIILVNKEHTDELEEQEQVEDTGRR